MMSGAAWRMYHRMVGGPVPKLFYLLNVVVEYRSPSAVGVGPGPGVDLSIVMQTFQYIEQLSLGDGLSIRPEEEGSVLAKVLGALQIGCEILI